MILDRKVVDIIFGDEGARLWEDQPFVWRQLKSETWAKRFLALCALVAVWDLEPSEVFVLAKTLVEKDPEDRVARSALDAIAHAFAGSYDETVSTYLAEIVALENRADGVRIKAYRALESVNSQTSSFVDLQDPEGAVERLKDRLERIQSESMEEIDWDWIRQIRAQQ